MALAATYSFTMDKGTTFSSTIIWKDANGVPINLSNYAARMQIRRSTTGNALIHALSSEDSTIVIDGPNGSMTLGIPADDSVNFPAGKHVYDLEVEELTTNVVTRLIRGSFVVISEVTHE